MIKKFVYITTLTFFLFFLVFIFPLKAVEKAYDPSNKNVLLVLDGPTVPHGMFAVFLITLGVLDFFEKGHYGGIWVNLNSGFYYEPSVGINWWEYFFEPLAIVPKNPWIPYYISVEETVGFGFNTLINMPRQRANELIQKYVHIKPYILHEVDQFIAEQFTNSYVIGVHYRGTDKVALEVNRLSFESMAEAIQETIQTIPIDQQNNYRIFIATDEQAFLDYITQRFSCPVVYTNAFRSSNGLAVHSQTSDSNYQKGKEALIDCLLLSRCNFLIRTESNLSRAAEFFNPSLPVRFLKTGWKFEIPVK